MSNNNENGNIDSVKYQVFVDDNFHFMDEEWTQERHEQPPGALAPKIACGLTRVILGL